MTGPAMRSAPVTGPATSSSDGNYVLTPAASYASTPASTSHAATNYASTPATSYASTAPTPAASYAANYASTQASTPASPPAGAAGVAHAGDYVSGEQYRYALTNFVRTNIYHQNHHHISADSNWPSDSPFGSGLARDSLRPLHTRKSRNSGPSSKSRSGKSHGSKHA
jgi:hypothetical protein